jgi:iron complex outermembrane receptor protein
MIEASGRVDFHSEYGTFFSPRVSALARSGKWTTRLSVGTGFFAPTPLTEETEAAGLSRLEVEGPLEAERGVSASFDVTRTDGPFCYTATAFASRISIRFESIGRRDTSFATSRIQRRTSASSSLARSGESPFR